MKTSSAEVAIVPYVLSTMHYSTALKKMEKSGEKFLLPYAFLGIKDISSVAFKIAFSVPQKKDFPLFEGMDISELIYDDFRRDWIGITLPRDLTFHKVVRGWKKFSLNLNSFIYPFENQTWEKVFCLSLREFYPEIKIIGYQHSSISKMLLHYFFSPYESKIIPLPDRIITNGRHTEKLFKESGYDPEKVALGGAIRYENVMKELKIPSQENQLEGAKSTVLVTTSISGTEAVELIWKAYRAFEDSAMHNVIIKCHPVLPYNKFEKDLINLELSKNFRLSQKSLPKLLKESSVC